MVRYFSINFCCLEEIARNTKLCINRFSNENCGIRSSIFLASEISSKAGKDIHVKGSSAIEAMVKLNIDIDQLHGTNDGNALLVASWTVSSSPEGKPSQSRYQFSNKAALQTDGYEALIASEKILLIRLAEEIAQTL